MIRKGDVVGRVSTLVELEPGTDELDSWTIEKLREVIAFSKALDNRQANDANKMLLDVQGVLSDSDNDIGTARVAPHVIELTNDTPLWQKPRRLSEPVNREIDRQCQELLSLDIIEYSNSHWSSPVVPVRKKDGQLRKCIDYRTRNKVTKTKSFPMPIITESIYRGHNTKFSLSSTLSGASIRYLWRKTVGSIQPLAPHTITSSLRGSHLV
jgi:hypothetical protein